MNDATADRAAEGGELTLVFGLNVIDGGIGMEIEGNVIDGEIECGELPEGIIEERAVIGFEMQLTLGLNDPSILIKEIDIGETAFGMLIARPWIAEVNKDPVDLIGGEDQIDIIDIENGEPDVGKVKCIDLTGGGIKDSCLRLEPDEIDIGILGSDLGNEIALAAPEFNEQRTLFFGARRRLSFTARQRYRVGGWEKKRIPMPFIRIIDPTVEHKIKVKQLLGNALLLTQSQNALLLQRKMSLLDNFINTDLNARRKFNQPYKVFDIALGTLDRGEGKSADGKADAPRGTDNAVDDLDMYIGIANDAVLTDLLTPRLKLRFNQSDNIAAVDDDIEDDGKNLIEGNERDIDGSEIDGLVENIGIDVANVGTLHANDAGIGTQRPCKLPIADIDRIDLPNAVLKHAICEAAGRRADIDSDLAVEDQVEGLDSL